MSKVSLSTKIIACFAIIIAMTVISSAISVMSSQASNTSTSDIADVNVPLSTLSSHAMDNITSMVLSLRTYVTSGNAADYDEGTEHFYNATDILKSIHPLIDNRTTARAAEERKILTLLETDLMSYALTARRSKAILAELATLTENLHNNSLKMQEGLTFWAKDTIGLHRLNNPDTRHEARSTL
jgi:CHASE3 domain sensor protein